MRLATDVFYGKVDRAGKLGKPAGVFFHAHEADVKGEETMYPNGIGRFCYWATVTTNQHDAARVHDELRGLYTIGHIDQREEETADEFKQRCLAELKAMGYEGD